MSSKIIVSKIAHQENLDDSIEKAVGLLGGWDNFIREGDIVLIKPNFNTADPFPASTSIDFLESVINLIYKAGAKAILVGESSTYSLNTRKVLEETGALELCNRLGAKVYIFDERNWVKKEILNGKYLKSVSIPEILDKVDKIVLLPCLKTHRYARFTAAIKLAVGLMRPRERAMLHMTHLEEKIAEINTVFKPDLIIMDARKCFVTRGPEAGEVREPNLILASTDRIAIDIEGLKILKSYPAENKLDLPLWEFPQIKRAVELGLGVKTENDYEVIEK
jgi:uncharacterized protein (DUF362 family)